MQGNRKARRYANLARQVYRVEWTVDARARKKLTRANALVLARQRAFDPKIIDPHYAQADRRMRMK